MLMTIMLLEIAKIIVILKMVWCLGLCGDNDNNDNSEKDMMVIIMTVIFVMIIKQGIFIMNNMPCC